MSEVGDGRVCNIGERGVRQRAAAGLVALVGGLALGAWSLSAPLGWPPRVVAVALLSFGVLALLQARAKT